MNAMRPYLSAFRMRLIAGMQYRAAAWAGVATQFFFGLLFIMIYQAFYASTATEPPMPWGQLVSYLWLQQAFLAIIMLWWQDGELLEGISSGQVAYELCRPYDLFRFWYVRLLAMKAANVALRCLPILIVTLLLPSPYNLSLPAGFGAAGLFLFSLVLSLLLMTAISMFIYILTFITLSSLGSRLIIGITAEFFQGAILPIPFMPLWLQQIANFLPFRYAADLPFRIYSGNISGRDALVQIGLQMLWLAGLLVLGQYCFKRVLRRVVIQGG